MNPTDAFKLWPKLVRYFRKQRAPDPEELAGRVMLVVAKCGCKDANHVWRIAINAFFRSDLYPDQLTPQQWADLDRSGWLGSWRTV